MCGLAGELRFDGTTAEELSLVEAGFPVPETQSNFVWLPLGERSEAFGELCDAHALSVRRFGSEGVRVSFGEVEANTRLLELCAQFSHPSTMPMSSTN